MKYILTLIAVAFLISCATVDTVATDYTDDQFQPVLNQHERSE